MKKILLFVSFVICLSVGACATPPSKSHEKPICAEWMMPDSVVYDTLGKRLATVLFSPQKVRCYYLVGKDSVGKDDIEIEKNFVRDTLLSTLKPTETAVLQYLLIRPEMNYTRDDSLMVMSPYVPILEFEFTRKKDIAHVVVSLSDMTWTVFFDDKCQFNFPYSNEKLIDTFCNYYISLYNRNQK